MVFSYNDEEPPGDITQHLRNVVRVPRTARPSIYQIRALPRGINLINLKLDK